MKVFVCGDTHIPIDVRKLTVKWWEIQKGLCKDDLLIILGDCGLLWEHEWSREELYWAKWLAEKKCTVCFLDGNHENFDRINLLEVVDFHGGKAGKAYSDKNGTIYHLKRGEVYTFGKKEVFVFGGAFSVDKESRIIGQSWWKEELGNYAECEYALDNLEKVGYTVDYILTHTCPKNVIEKMNFNIFKGELVYDSNTIFFDAINKRVSFKEWHFGHFHADVHLNGTYICHYNWEPVRII